MATITWPTELPLALIAGRSIQPVDPTLRTEFESGQVRSRREFSATPENTTLTWIFDRQQALRFKWFYSHVLSDGVEWFNYPIHRPEGLVPHEIQFVGIYEEEPYGPPSQQRWRYTARIQTFLRASYGPGAWEPLPIAPPRD